MSKKPFPKQVTVEGITGIYATIYRNKQTKNGKRYVNYTLAYSLLGKMRRETFADLADAQAAGEDAVRRIAEGNQAILELGNRDREIYLRANAVAVRLGIPLDVLAQEGADTRAILNGMATPAESARYFVLHHSKELPRITVPEAVKKCLEMCEADGKSKVRMHELKTYLNRLAKDINTDVSELTPSIVSRYLTEMTASERTKRNARDVIRFFGRWLVLHGYLAKGTDLVDGVQKYSKRVGEIQTYTPEELSKLLENATDAMVPYVAIAAFAGLRQIEIKRLDWSEVKLREPKADANPKDYGFIEVKAQKAKTKVRRLAPIKPVLAEWLRDYRKTSGPVCKFGRIEDQLARLSIAAGIEWKKNALRHSHISYRVAECADVPRVAYECGNSPQIIRTNYLEVVEPDQAKAWFNVMPGAAESDDKVTNLCAKQAV